MDIPPQLISIIFLLEGIIFLLEVDGDGACFVRALAFVMALAAAMPAASPHMSTGHFL